MAQFSLAWDRYRQNICQGLTTLQQNGEFVDMTIAADGHYVKVHQMVMSLVSPYIKELIISAQCPHPVIVLNRVSYATLLSILEYIYTGEVIVNTENLEELLFAAKELHIKGLEDTKVEIAHENRSRAEFAKAKTDEGQPLSSRPHFKISNVISQSQKEPHPTTKQISMFQRTPRRQSVSSNNDTGENFDDTYFHDDDDVEMKEEITKVDVSRKKDNNTSKEVVPIQYTLSNHGAIQMIVNRNLYNLRYTSVKDNGTRRWWCTEAIKKSCKAIVVTKGGVIVQRIAAHNHPYHDKRILAKVRQNLVYSALNDAEDVMKMKKKSKENQGNTDPSPNTTRNTDREDTTDAE